jgi:hypothetical protein
VEWCCLFAPTSSEGEWDRSIGDGEWAPESGKGEWAHFTPVSVGEGEWALESGEGAELPSRGGVLPKGN